MTHKQAHTHGCVILLSQHASVLYQAGFAIPELHDTLLGVILICCILSELFASQYNTETTTNTDTHQSTVTYVGLAENWRVGVGAGAVQAFIAIAT